MSARHGIRFLKLYFMVGLPGETEEDLAAVVALVKRTAKIVPTKVALTPFVPKRHTPFAGARMPAESELRRVLRGLKRELWRIGTVNVRAESAREARIEALLSRGGRELAGALEQGRDALRRLARDS